MSISTLKIAWRNLWRNRTRTMIALSAITLAQVFVVCMGALMNGMFQDMFDTLTGPFVGHVKVSTRNWQREYDKAEQAYLEAKEESPEDEKAVDLALAAMLEARGNTKMFDEFLDEAYEDYEKAVALYQKHDVRAGQARMFVKLGRLRFRSDYADDAPVLFERARVEFELAKDKPRASVAGSLADDTTPISDAIPERILKVEALKEHLKSIEGVTTVSPRILTSALAFEAGDSGTAADAHAALVAGIDLELETSNGGLLDAYGDRPLPPPGAVVVGQGLARRLGVGEGSKIAIIGQRVDESPVDALFTVAAVLRSDVDVINSRGIAMAYADAADLFAADDSAHEVIIRGVDHEKAGELADEIRAIPALIDADVKPWYEANPEIAQMLEMKDAMDGIFVIILFVAAAAGIANTMMMSTYERKREFGMLLGVGCGPRRVVSMVMVESVVLGLLGVLIGSAIGVVIVKITSVTGINYAAMTGVADQGNDISFSGLNFSWIMYPKLDMRFVTNGMIAVTVTSLIASLLPALSSSRLEPMEALRS
jgi:ABC-type lipoprotein release transport system permease subunit